MLDYQQVRQRRRLGDCIWVKSYSSIWILGGKQISHGSRSGGGRMLLYVGVMITKGDD